MATVFYTSVDKLPEIPITEEDRRTRALVDSWKPIGGNYYMQLTYNPSGYSFIPCNHATRIRWDDGVELLGYDFACPCDDSDCELTLFDRLPEDSIANQTPELVEIVKPEIDHVFGTDLSELADYIGPMRPRLS